MRSKLLLQPLLSRRVCQGCAALGLLLGSACATPSAAALQSPPTAKADSTESNSAAPPGDQVPTIVVSKTEVINVLELLERGREHLHAERYEAAIADFRLVSENATQKDSRLEGLFAWATALDLSGDPKGALQIYSRYRQEVGQGDERERASVRMLRILVYLERFSDAGKIAHSIEISGRNPLEVVAIYAARALADLNEDRLEQAGRNISRGRSAIEAHGLDRVTVPPLDVAALYFSLGELRRHKAEKILFDPLPPDFTTSLEERCQLILDAQAAYSEAMRSQDAHWSSMAGVRVGQLYQELHQDLMAMPRPASADTSERTQLFEGALRLRYSILLRKAVSMMRATVALLDRTDQESRWREKAREALKEIEEAEQKEQAILNSLPYTRAQLQRALDDISDRGGKK